MKKLFIFSALCAGTASAGCTPQAAWIDAIRAEEARYNMPQNLLYSLIKKESQFCPNARSRAGAMGLAQFMPGTARLLGVNPWQPVPSIRAAAKYLAQQYRTFNSWPLALAAYNAGPGNVMKYKGIPPFRETRGYVATILRTTGPVVATARSRSAPVIRTTANEIPPLSPSATAAPGTQSGAGLLANAASGPWTAPDEESGLLFY